jgi:Flp pilus assembly protein TadG
MATSPDRRPPARLREFLRIDARGNHRGALSPAVAILAVMIFTLAGLVIDGGRQLGAKSRAVGYAQEAARVGAATIELNTSEARIDITKAGAAVAAFCAEVSANDPAVQQCGTTETTGESVTVHVVVGNRTTFLGMVGIDHLDAAGTGEAHAEQGINKADETPQIPPIIVSSTKDGPGVPTGPANPPTLDLPCPTWTIGSPTPQWTLTPFPFPATCTPSITPSPTAGASTGGTPPTTTPGTPPTSASGGAPGR